VDDEVFRALADPSRRTLLDRLFERDGQTLGDLETALPAMTRFGVMKHLRVLEGASLVTSRKVGRERHHYLNPVPIRRVHDRWLDRYAIRAADLLADLKTTLEIDTMTSPDTASPAATGVEAAPRHVFATFIRATPEAIWRALTESDFTTRYWYGSTVHSDWTAGAPWELRTSGGQVGITGEVLEANPRDGTGQLDPDRRRRCRLAVHHRGSQDPARDRRAARRQLTLDPPTPADRRIDTDWRSAP
jgi:DNA-binding transcriptional ArsR family regulator